MKVVAFNGSARKDGNTAILVNTVFKELKKEGIKTELVQLCGKEDPGLYRLREMFYQPGQAVRGERRYPQRLYRKDAGC